MCCVLGAEKSRMKIPSCLEVSMYALFEVHVFNAPEAIDNHLFSEAY